MDLEGVEGMSFAPHVVLDYTNRSGVLSRRTVVPIMSRFTASPYHGNEEDVYLVAFDLGKDDVRHFRVRDIHAWQEASRSSGGARELIESGYERSGRWPALRRQHLAAENACQACGVVKHLEVHHVLPYHLYPAKELDPTNLITLCETPSHNCHLLFGHCLNFTWYNPTVRDDVVHFRNMIRNRRDT